MRSRKNVAQPVLCALRRTLLVARDRPWSAYVYDFPNTFVMTMLAGVRKAGENPCRA